MTECTLHNLLTSCQYPQVFWIYQMNDYDENLLLSKGTKQEMLEDDGSFDLIDHINDVVEYWTIREDGAMFVRLRMNDRAKELYSDDYVKRWDRFNPTKRPYLYSAEMDDFTHCIYGSSEYLHPYGDPNECHHYDTADRKTESDSEIQNNSTISKMEQVEDEPQYEMGMGTLKCDNCSEYGSFKCTKCDGEMYFKRLEPNSEPQTEPLQTCSVNGRPYSECSSCEHFRCTADDPQTEETEMERLERIDNEIEDAWARIRELTDEPQTEYERGYRQGKEDEINKHHVGR